MIILGINDTHDASACLVKDGELLIALSEERPQRIKSMGGFPHHAIRKCFQETGISPRDLAHVAIASERLVPNNIHNVAASFSIEDYMRWEEEYYYPIIYEGRTVRLSDVFPDYEPRGDLAYPVKKIPFITTNEITDNEMDAIREMRLRSTAEILGIESSKISFHRHHRCHALYGYYANPNKAKQMLVVTADSGGDGAYSSIFSVNNGNFNRLLETRNNLIGKIYSSTTLLMGMRPNEHEYKVMGLAPYASDYHKTGPREVYLHALKVQGLDFVRNPEMKDLFFYFRDRLKAYRFDGIAGGLQDFVEIRICEWFYNIAQETGTRDFVFCGGVANNVKANKRLSELDFVDSIYIPPGPGDESLSIGAAFCCIYDQVGPAQALQMIKPVETAYLGPNVEAADHEHFKNHPFIRENYDRREYDPSTVAGWIAKGEVVALCHGRMEFGPRALGHRSLVADPSNPDSVRKINDLIKKRDFWMPFTPSILEDCYDEYVTNPKRIDSSFMTVTFDTTDKGREHLKAAIHPYDHTVRPQIVYRKTCPIYYELIDAFRKQTGIGAVLNTSLNIHGKPIVMSPMDMLREILINGEIPVKCLLVGNSFYVKRNAVN